MWIFLQLNSRQVVENNVLMWLTSFATACWLAETFLGLGECINQCKQHPTCNSDFLDYCSIMDYFVFLNVLSIH